jgi:hypothetical protein
MENLVPSGWNHLDLQELIRKTKELTLVAWIGGILSPQDVLTKCNELDVQARRLKVGTREVWQNEIENNGYVVSYHDGKGNLANYNDPNAVHYTLQEYGAIHGNDPEYQSKTGDVLISAFDTIKKKRVIVDGIHRAAVMSSEYSKDSDFTDRKVYEWYGPNVKEIFPYDFMQFYRV